MAAIEPEPPGPSAAQPSPSSPAQNTTSPSQSPSSLPLINQLPLAPASPALSHSDARKARRALRSSRSASPPSPPSPASQSRPSTPRSTPRTPHTPFAPAMPLRPLFIASLGNPGPAYAHTPHSAGHIVLSTLPALAPLPLPALRAGFSSASSASSAGADGRAWTLWQSPAYMNVSGPPLAKAFQRFRASAQGRGGVLVVLHDELELDVGRVKMKVGGSHKGHNGLKSVMGTLGKDFVRIGVGIGRPRSRESDDVAAYVLGRMGRADMEKVQAAGADVIGLLMQVEAGT